MTASWSQDAEELWRTGRGRSVEDLERDLHALEARYPFARLGEYHVQLTARALSDPQWARHHPLGAVAFAWRHRRSTTGRGGRRRGFVRCLRAIWRPRFAG